MGSSSDFILAGSGYAKKATIELQTAAMKHAQDKHYEQLRSTATISHGHSSQQFAVSRYDNLQSTAMKIRRQRSRQFAEHRYGIMLLAVGRSRNNLSLVPSPGNIGTVPGHSQSVRGSTLGNPLTVIAYLGTILERLWNTPKTIPV